MNYRVYADGTVVSECNFPELNEAMDYNGSGSDDYEEVYIADVLVEHIEAEALGK